uniref:Cyclin-dependent kinase 2 homolog n=1 Tax=Globisporangium ultimum (strain ATCC 200006 / CBS 805.95 / DAOM BR144) TaxID=431595 RepID=K3WDI0_GLOUD
MRRSSLRRPESLTDKYRILGKIGEGTYGMVFKAEAYSNALLPRPSTGSSSSSGGNSGSAAGSNANGDDEEPMTFAIKLVKSHKEGKNDVVLSSATVREIKLLRELHHDNVVHLHDVHLDPREKTLALVFEYADHDLHDIIVQSKQKPLSEYARKSLMYQILKGVDYMHDAWVMHRDMKPQNILVVGHGRKRGQVKLADFGLARVYKEPIKALSDVERVVVTLWYRAPELLLGAKHYTKAVDLWAVGCIFAEIINTRELFCGKEVEGSNAPFQKDQLDKIFKVLGMPSPQNWEGLDNLPEYSHVVQMGRERKYPSQSELKNAVKFGSGRSGAALYDLISRLLEYVTKMLSLNLEPVSFRTQTVEPVSDEQLPWKIKKDPVPTAADPNAKAGGDAAAGGSPHRDRDRDGRSSQHHASSSQHSNDPNYRKDSSAASSSRNRSHHSSSVSRGSESGRRSDRPNSGDANNARDDGRSSSNAASSSRSRSSAAGSGAAAAAPNTGSANAGGSGWRDRSVGRGDSSRSGTNAASGSSSGKRPSGDRPPSGDRASGGGDRASSDRPAAGASVSERPTSAGRPRSPKQQRRR